MTRRLLAVAALALAAACSHPVPRPSGATADLTQEAAADAVARGEWTVAARLPRAADRPASRVAEPAPASPELVTEEPSGDGAIGGWVVWADGQPTDRVKLVLKGAPETPLAHLQWVARTDAAGRFDFTGIPAGSYMLTNRIAGAPDAPTWRLQVSVRAGERISLDLGETNAAAVRDDFPDA